MIVRREVFEAIGLIDEEYFMYFEEVDFCHRARRAGWPCWYVPSARVVAPGRAEFGRDRPRRRARNRRPAYWFRARRRYFLSHHGRVKTLLADLAWSLGLRLVPGAAIPLAQARQGPSTDVLGLHPLQLLAGEEDDPSVGDAVQAEEAGGPPPLNRGDRNRNPPGIGFLAPAARGPANPRRRLVRAGVLGGRRPPLRQLADGLWPKPLRAPLTLMYRLLFKVVEWTCGISLPYTVPAGTAGPDLAPQRDHPPRPLDRR